MVVEPSSVSASVRPCVRPSTISILNISTTSQSIAIKFYQKHHWGRERLHKVLGQVGSELWFPWQQIAPIGLQWEKCYEHSSPYIFDRIFFILAGNEDSHKISDEFKIRQDLTMDCGVSCP